MINSGVNLAQYSGPSYDRIRGSALEFFVSKVFLLQQALLSELAKERSKRHELQQKLQRMQVSCTSLIAAFFLLALYMRTIAICMHLHGLVEPACGAMQLASSD